MNCPECEKPMLESLDVIQESDMFYYVIFSCVDIGCHLSSVKLTYWREDV